MSLQPDDYPPFDAWARTPYGTIRLSPIPPEVVAFVRQVMSLRHEVHILGADGEAGGIVLIDFFRYLEMQK